MFAGLAIIAGLAGGHSPSAEAGALPPELRLGIFDHNVEPAGNEDGIDLNAEALISLPFNQGATGSSVLDRLIDPRIAVGATLNTGDATDLAYAGLVWTVPIGDVVFFEAGIAAAIHDGPLDEDGVASYGCRLAFRETASIGMPLDDRWRIMATVEHMSNADLCGRNRGLTNAGVRLGYALD
ncbi:MAG: acyloxyacyl hydrolase [Hyphomicrobiaceae bacterium]